MAAECGNRKASSRGARSVAVRIGFPGRVVPGSLKGAAAMQVGTIRVRLRAGDEIGNYEIVLIDKGNRPAQRRIIGPQVSAGLLGEGEEWRVHMVAGRRRDIVHKRRTVETVGNGRKTIRRNDVMRSSGRVPGTAPIIRESVGAVAGIRGQYGVVSRHEKGQLVRMIVVVAVGHAVE